VLSFLLGALAVPVAIALATGSTAAWWVALALLPVVLAYVAVLFHARRMMAEREINLAFGGQSIRSLGDLEDIFAVRREEELEPMPIARVGSMR
jgi:hypothetical protein